MKLLTEDSVKQVKGHNTKSLHFKSKTTNVHEKDIHFLSTRKGIYVKSNNAFWVSSCGTRVWGFRSYQDSKNLSKFKLVMLDFEYGTDLLYDYEHEAMSESVLVSDPKNLAISGGWDGKIVFHDLTNGKTLKIIKNKNRPVRSLCLLWNILAVGNNNFIVFIEIEKKKIINIEDYKSRAFSILCLQSNLDVFIKKRSKGLFLFVGGTHFKKIEKESVPSKVMDKIKKR